jgi:glycosyltransferase involved in cell wall biosynthesis
MYSSINFLFDVWWIVFDMDWSEEAHRIIQDLTAANVRVKTMFIKNHTWGNVQRNAAINFIKDDFIYFLDDDNIIHPELYENLLQAHAQVNKKVYLVKQDVEDDIRGIDPRQCYIDLAQMVVHRRMFDEMPFVNLHDADGIFIEHWHKTSPGDFCFIHKPLAYYNKLEAKK